ncbi:SMP-30/gluconolactonase/LRE family protein [Nocardia sp. NPDC051030]|uniref:SMP-30/gluconolactonase/LRE family protein n=1 Tax=Nocardia sp. NPDC051030 TaxID=3155162 RepID=UPI0034438BB2
MKTLTAQPCSLPPGRLCEGPVWDDRTQELLWVDIPAGQIHCAVMDVDGTAVDLRHRSTRRFIGPVSAVLPSASGGLIATMRDTVVRIDELGAVTPITVLPLPEDGIRRRLNDAKVDPRGRLLTGSMSEDEITGTAALYQVDSHGRARELRTGVTISNGLGWSPDGGTLYYADTPTGRVDAFDYDVETGTISNGRPFVSFDYGLPDGLSVASDGSVWVAVWDGGQVRAFNPDGEPCAVVEVGASQVTSCAFAGPDLDILVITTAAQGPTGEPDAGRLFTCRPGLTGLAVTPYADARAVRAGDR